MNKKAIIGTFFNDQNMAVEDAEKKSKKGFAKFSIIEINGGYIVIPESMAKVMPGVARAV